MRADKQKQADKTREAPIPIREQAKNWLSTDTPILNYTKGFRDAGLLGAPGADETSGSRDTSSGHSAGGFGAAVQGGDISGEFSTGASNAAKNFALGAEYTGSGILGGLEGISDLIGTATWKGVQGITSLGGLAPNKVSEYAGQAADAFLENSITRAWEDSLEERYRPTEGQRKIGQAEQTIARMLPSVAASVVTGSPQVGLAGMGMGAGGSSATEAKREGAGAGRALGYGIASGMLETAIESIAGGIPGLGRGVLSTAFERIMTSPIGGRLIQALGEGGEEALSALLTPYLKRAFYGKDAKNATGEEIAQSALMGIIASGVLQGGLALPSCGKGNDTKGLAISGNDDYDLNSDLEPGLFPEDDYEDLNGDLSFAEDKPEDYEDLNNDLRALAKGAGEAGKRANTAAEGAGDGLKMSDKQFGKKVGKHAEDFGLDPSSSESRDFVRNTANEIFRKPTEIREGVFRGQGVVLPNGANATGKVRFYIQGNDVVITDMSNNFITIMKDGINNLYIKKAMRIWP